MPDHAHFVTLRHREDIEEIVGFLKRAATRKLTEHGVHPLGGYRGSRGRIPTPWVVGGWNRYLNTDEAIVGAIDYVKSNPTKIGLSRQSYDFVQPYAK